MRIRFFSGLLTLCGAVAPMTGWGVSFPTTAGQPVSKYGLIQNVQNYSSNPFWSPNSQYNQRMPQPVYVDGPDLNAGDCQRTVSALVASYCATRNYCVSVSLGDARPALILQLSNLPNYNYVSACAGYVDSEFESYKAKNSTAAPRSVSTAFPTAMPTMSGGANDVTVGEPTAQGWAAEMAARQQELLDLQSQNGAGNESVVRAEFPATAADLSFADKNANLREGYMPYKDSSAYKQINLKLEESKSNTVVSDNEKKSDGKVADKNSGAGNAANTSVIGDNKVVNGAGDVAVTAGTTTDFGSESLAGNNKVGADVLAAGTAALGGAAAVAVGVAVPAMIGAGSAAAALTAWTGPGAIIAGVGAAIAAGAAILLSESDVLIDPVTNERVGCNVAFEAADRKVDIGGFMFCAQYTTKADGAVSLSGYVSGYARQCLQSKRNPSAQRSRILGAFKNDFWNKECVQRLCDASASMPPDGAQVEWQADMDNVCWRWRNVAGI